MSATPPTAIDALIASNFRVVEPSRPTLDGKKCAPRLGSPICGVKRGMWRTSHFGVSRAPAGPGRRVDVAARAVRERLGGVNTPVRMPSIAFFEPRIPENTGAAIRLSAVTGAPLRLVEPLGFSLEESRLRRAGLDYHDLATVTVHPSFDALCAALARRARLCVHRQGRHVVHRCRLRGERRVALWPRAHRPTR